VLTKAHDLFNDAIIFEAAQAVFASIRINKHPDAFFYFMYGLGKWKNLPVFFFSCGVPHNGP